MTFVDLIVNSQLVLHITNFWFS